MRFTIYASAKCNYWPITQLLLSNRRVDQFHCNWIAKLRKKQLIIGIQRWIRNQFFNKIIIAIIAYEEKYNYNYNYKL